MWLSRAFSSLQPKADCTLTPNEFLHSSPEAPHTTEARETSASEGRNYYQGIQLANPEFTEVLGSFTSRKAGTWDRFFHFPSEGRHAEDYSDSRKIQRLRPGSDPPTRVPEASMLTTRPPKQLYDGLNLRRNVIFFGHLKKSIRSRVKRNLNKNAY